MTDQPLFGRVVESYDQAVELLTDARKAGGLTQAALGERLGVVQATITHREGGKRIYPADDLFATAHALGYDVAFIPRQRRRCPECGCEVRR